MASLYHLPECSVNSLTGDYLARNHCDRVDRVCLALDLYYGQRHLINPTLLQTAHLARVPYWFAVLVHKRVLTEAARLRGLPTSPSQTNGRAATLAPEIDDAELINIARRAGTDRVLDAAIAAESAVQ